MKKIINNANDVVDEMLTGYAKAYTAEVERLEGSNCIVSRKRRKDKVNLIIGGGSGHEPLFFGFVGEGLADAAVCGNIFAAPNPQLIFNTTKAVNQGKGVIYVYGNYAGDNLNFDMAEELCGMEGIQTAHVRVWDDCASAPKERITDRRGIAGDIFVIKICGAACDAGLAFEEVLRITEKARDNINTIGIATSPGTIPGINKPTFELGEDEIEYGMGMHGEPGIERAKIAPADVLAARMYEEISREMALDKNDEVCLLVNGLGSTTLLELCIIYRKVSELLENDGIRIYNGEIKNYCTCQEMGGFSITILKLDEELKRYYDAPCSCPYYSKKAR